MNALKKTLLTLLIASLLTISGCASSSSMCPPAPPALHLDPILMAEPNYTETLLKLLSE